MEILENYIFEILATVITAVASFIGLRIKDAYTKYINTQTKKEVVKDTVNYVEQVFKDIHGQEKLEKAKEKALEWLGEKGIGISETELEILIESAVNGFNQKGE